MVKSAAALQCIGIEGVILLKGRLSNDSKFKRMTAIWVGSPTQRHQTHANQNLWPTLFSYPAMKFYDSRTLILVFAALCFLSSSLSLCVCAEVPPTTLPASPLVRYEAGGKQLGSWKLSFDSPLGVYDHGLSREENRHALFRTAVLVRAEELVHTSLRNDDSTIYPTRGPKKNKTISMQFLVDEAKVSAVLILLPSYPVASWHPEQRVNESESTTVQSDDAVKDQQLLNRSTQVVATPDKDSIDTARFSALEEFLLNTKFLIPVYFTSAEAMHSLNSQSPLLPCPTAASSRRDCVPSSSSVGVLGRVNQNMVHLSVSHPEYQKRPLGVGYNLSGWLGPPDTDPTTSQRPIIAIVTHYDAFAASPALAVGADTSASGMIAFIELARIFSTLLKEKTDISLKYDLMFLTTGSSALFFRGMQSWLLHADSNLLERIQFALCLDTLTRTSGVTAVDEGNQWYLHLSRMPKEEENKALVENLKAAFDRHYKSAGGELQIVTKKVKKYDYVDVPWQHEWLVRRGISTATLSRIGEPISVQRRSSILDRNFSPAFFLSIQETVQAIAEGLIPHVFDSNGKEETTNSAPATLSDESWAELFAVPRMYHAMPENASKPFLDKIQNIMQGYLSGVEVSKFSFGPSAAEYTALSNEENREEAAALGEIIAVLNEIFVYYNDGRMAKITSRVNDKGRRTAAANSTEDVADSKLSLSEEVDFLVIHVTRYKGMVFDLIFLAGTAAYLYILQSIFQGSSGEEQTAVSRLINAAVETVKVTNASAKTKQEKRGSG